MFFYGQFERVIVILGDDPSTAQPDEVFAIFDAFLNSMTEAKLENEAARKRKEEEERRILQEAEVLGFTHFIIITIFSLIFSRSQMRKRTIDRKTSKEAVASHLSKGLGISNGKSNGHTNGDKGEFDDLISALRAGDVFGEDLVKMRRNRQRRANGSPHRTSQTSSASTPAPFSRENSRERALSRKAVL